MQQFTQKFSNVIKKHKIISTFLAIVILACVGWSVFNGMPRPLGDKMEYLGKDDFFFSESGSYMMYYYGTNISPDDSRKYFHGAQLSSSQPDMSNLIMQTYEYKGEYFTVAYHLNKQLEHFTTGKKYIVSIINSDYSLAKQSLKD